MATIAATAAIAGTNFTTEGGVRRVDSRLRAWVVCVRCGHRWKPRASTLEPRCRACEARLRAIATAESARLATGRGTK